MKLKGVYHPSNLLTGLLLLLVLILGFALFNSYATQDADNLEKAHDAIRISDIDLIHQGIRDYYSQNSRYPACLYADNCTKSLEGTSIMPTVAKDPLTHLEYSYAAFGTGANCQGYHVGASLERTGSQALLTGSDTAPQPASALCQGSKPDFSGVSYAQGGQPCNDKVGVPAPADSPKAETCYDLSRAIAQPSQTAGN